MRNDGWMTLAQLDMMLRRLAGVQDLQWSIMSENNQQVKKWLDECLEYGVLEVDYTRTKSHGLYHVIDECKWQIVVDDVLAAVARVALERS